MTLSRNLFILILFIQSTCFAQTTDALNGQSMLAKTDSLISSGQLDSAKKYLQLSIEAFFSEGDTLQYFESLNKKSLIAYDQVEYDSSLLIAQSALQKMTDMKYQNTVVSAEFHRRIGVVYEVRDGNFTKAVEFYNRGISLVEKSNEKTLLRSQLGKDLAIAILSQGYLDSAQNILQKTITLQKEDFGREFKELADSYRLQAAVYTLASNTPMALKYYRKALETIDLDADGIKKQEVKGDVFGNLAYTHQENGYYDSAIFYYHKQKSINEEILDSQHRKLAYLYGNFSLLKALKGELDSANFYIEKKLRINEATLSQDSPDLANAYSQAASILAEYSRYEEAQTYAKKGLRILESSFGESHSETFNPVFQLGNINLKLGNAEISLDYFEKAIKIAKGSEVARHQPMISAYLGIADNYFALDKPDLAVKYTQKAYKITTDQFNTEHETSARAKLRFGEFYSVKGDFEKAMDELDIALKIFTEQHGARNLMVSQSKLNISEVSLKLGREEDAISHLQAASFANSYTYELDVNRGPELEDMIDPILGIQIVTKLADVMNLMYKKTNDVTWLERSKTQLEMSVELLGELVFETSIESDAMRVLDQFHKSYSRLLMTSLEMKDQGLLEQDAFNETVLKYSEASRNINLTFNRYKADQNNGLRDGLDSLKLLNREIGFAKSELLTNLRTTGDSLKIDYYEQRLFELTNTKNLLRSNSKDGTYLDFKKEKGSKTIADYQQALAENESVIEYFIADSTLFSLVINNQEMVVFTQKLDQGFYSNIEDYLSFKNNEINRYAKGAYSLYGILIEPLEYLIKNSEKWIILPEKELWNINFDLLLSRQPLKNDPRSFEYILRKHHVSYSNSLDRLFQDNSRHGYGEMLAFAYEEGEDKDLNDIFIFRSNDKSKISGTVSEVKEFNKNFRGDYFYGTSATEEEFKKRATDYSIIHLALHGDVDDTNLNASHLIFNQKNPESKQDGYLYPFELYDLELNAEMVVLSACHTGVGEIVNGEGVMSIGRGFLYAGAKSLLLSQWEVSDATAPKIITSFYEYLDKGNEKDKALQLAKLDFLETANNITASPLYWGSFFILGDTDSIDLKRSRSWMLWSGIVLLLVLGFFFTQKRGLLVGKPKN